MNLESLLIVARNPCKVIRGITEEEQRIGVLNMNACIAIPKEDDEHLSNDSCYFHEKMGFYLVGTFHNSGYKNKVI